MTTNHVFVTGGSRGIGAAAVLAFARAGYDVAFTYNAHPDAAEAVLPPRRSRRAGRPLSGNTGRCGGFCTGAGRRGAGTAGVGQPAGACLQCGHCAGQLVFTDTTDEDWHRMMAVDLDGAFYARRAVLPGMVHQKYGRILLVSSMWGADRRQLVRWPTARPLAGLIGLGRPSPRRKVLSGITVNVIACRASLTPT